MLQQGTWAGRKEPPVSTEVAQAGGGGGPSSPCPAQVSLNDARGFPNLSGWGTVQTGGPPVSTPPSLPPSCPGLSPQRGSPHPGVQALGQRQPHPVRNLPSPALGPRALPMDPTKPQVPTQGHGGVPSLTSLPNRDRNPGTRTALTGIPLGQEKLHPLRALKQLLGCVGIPGGGTLLTPDSGEGARGPPTACT